MENINICKACVNINNGVTARISEPHTAEEIGTDKERAKRSANRLRNILVAMSGIKAQNESQGKIKCPECGGDLHYGKASNGHVRAKCQSDGCLSFME